VDITKEGKRETIKDIIDHNIRKFFENNLHMKDKNIDIFNPIFLTVHELYTG
jgi:hypothetical protein